MNINEYLQIKNGISVTTGKVSPYGGNYTVKDSGSPADSDFAKALKDATEKNSAVEFSKHAIERVFERNIDLENDNTLERLNKAVNLAEKKGSNDALIMIDNNAFIVSVKNNKVITTLSANDLVGNIFTNIDSTVIM